MKNKFFNKKEVVEAKKNVSDFKKNIFLQKNILGGNKCIGRDELSSNIVLDNFAHTPIAP